MTSNEKNPDSSIYWPTLGWEGGSPQQHGMKDELLSLAHETIRRDLPDVYSLLVVRKGMIVFERYYQGFDATSLFDIRSATKSFISTLIGIAIKEKHIPNLDQKVLSYFPEYESANKDPRKSAISIRDLLMMKSGLAWDEELDFVLLDETQDWLPSILNVPMATDPGAVFDYNSGVSHILSAMIHQATGMTTLDFAQQRLFSPLGIVNHHWESDPTGITLGYAGLSLTARDLAKLGLLYARQGMWEGERILTTEYVRDSTTAWSSGGFPEEAEYGYHWWVLPSGPHSAYFAAGYGGQYLWVVPDLDLIVVTTANSQLPPSLVQDHNFLITDFVVASAS